MTEKKRGHEGNKIHAASAGATGTTASGRSSLLDLTVGVESDAVEPGVLNPAIVPNVELSTGAATDAEPANGATAPETERE